MLPRTVISVQQEVSNKSLIRMKLRSLTVMAFTAEEKPITNYTQLMPEWRTGLQVGVIMLNRRQEKVQIA
jgi:hypothetical protein